MIDSPLFLSLGEVVEIHRDQIERYGGDSGIRGLGLLESALAMLGAGFGGRYLHPNLSDMAAAYLFHIIKNHPFVDGNKRTGAVAAIVFLSLNGIEIDASEKKFEKTVMSVAEGRLGKNGVAEFFRKHSGG